MGIIKKNSIINRYVLGSNGQFTPLEDAQAAAGKLYRGYQSGADSAIAGMVGAADGAAKGVNDSYNLYDVTGTYNDYLNTVRQYSPESLRSQYAADTQQSYDNAWGQNERELSRMGIDPTSGK